MCCSTRIELCNVASLISGTVYVDLSSACGALNGQTIEFNFATYIGGGTDSARFDAANPITLGGCSFNATLVFDCMPNNVILTLRNPATNESCLQINFGSFHSGGVNTLPKSASSLFVGNGTCTCCTHLTSVTGNLSE